MASCSLANAAAKLCGTMSGLELRACPNFTAVGPKSSNAVATRWALVMAVAPPPSDTEDDQKASHPLGASSCLLADANLPAEAMRGIATSRTATDATSAARRAITADEAGGVGGCSREG